MNTRKLYAWDCSLKYLQHFSCYQHIFLSLLTNLDIYKLVSDPFHYSDFCQRSNIAKIALKGTVICIVLAFIDILKTLYELLWIETHLITDQDALSTLEMVHKICLSLNIVKTFITKVLMGIANVYISQKIKKT